MALAVELRAKQKKHKTNKQIKCGRKKIAEKFTKFRFQFRPRFNLQVSSAKKTRTGYINFVRS